MNGIDFSIFGEKAEQIKAIFTICQLRDVSPTFSKFLEANPEYDEYHQSTDTQD